MPRAGLDLDKVLQAAADLADTHGAANLSLSLLAQKLNIRTPSLYNHIDGLPGLRSRLALHGMEQLHSRLVRATAGRKGPEAVRALCAAYLDFARARPGLYEMTLMAPDPLDRELAQAGERLVRLMTEHMADLDLSGDAALHAIRALRSMLHGFSSLEQKGGFGLPLDLNDSFRLMLDTFLAGLTAMRDSQPDN